jgi:Fe-S-cluster containining protein
VPPIAEIEAYRIAELVEELPETQRREVKERFEKAVAHFEKIGWFEKLTAAVKKSKAEQEQVVLEYFHEGIPCPFLVNESCSIHPDRPLACREYLVTSPAENCANPTQQTIRTVKIPARPSKVVRKIGRTKNIGPDFLPLILSLKWVEGNTGNFPTKTGESWMADFFTNLTKSKIPRHNRK